MIIKLPKSLCNQIAAGEVVERPSSVVKELVENAIDAGARNIVLEFVNAGKESISIRDDGSGIEESDLPLVFERNATSKIRSIEDLYNVQSLGFRGEALASISSVAKITLISRHKDSSLGKKIVYYNDEVKESRDLACSQGTSIVVSDLFYNTPARYKFLKSSSSEKASIMLLMTNMALSYPEISFTVIADGSEEFRSTGRGSLEETVKLLFESDFAKALLPIEATNSGIRISGFVAAPQYSKGNRSRQFLFVNGRMVNSKWIGKVIESAYEGMMMKRRYPAYVIKIEVQPSMLDVNIHPQKLEVKFEREDILESLLFNLVRNVLVGRRISREADWKRVSSYEAPKVEPTPASEELSRFEVPLREEPGEFDELTEFQDLLGREEEAAELAPMPEERALQKAERDRRAPHWERKPASSPKLREELLASDADSETEANAGARREAIATKGSRAPEWESADSIEEAYLNALKRSKQTAADREEQQELHYDDLQVIAQVFDTFLLCACKNSIYFIDQHAAHERVLFERFYKAFKEKKVEQQILMEPIVYTANPLELDGVERAMDFLQTLRVELERQTEKTWLIKSMPVFSEPILPEELIDMIDKYGADGGETYHRYFIDKIIMQACKAAIKAGDVLNHTQMQDLINMLKTCDNPHSCPHGRPTTIEMKRSDFDKLFKRVL